MHKEQVLGVNGTRGILTGATEVVKRPISSRIARKAPFGTSSLSRVLAACYDNFNVRDNDEYRATRSRRIYLTRQVLRASATAELRNPARGLTLSNEDVCRMIQLGIVVLDAESREFLWIVERLPSGINVADFDISQTQVLKFSLT